MKKFRRRRAIHQNTPRMVYNHSLNDFVMLPGVPNKSLDIAPGTKTIASPVGDQAGLPVPSAMLPSLPNTTAEGYYADNAYIKSWDGTSVVGACSPYPNATGQCGSNVDIIPIALDGGTNNAMVNGSAMMSEDMMQQMLPGGSMAIGPNAAYSPFAFDIFAPSQPRAESILQKTVASVADPLIGIPTSSGLMYQKNGSTASTTGVLSNFQVISEKNALGRLGDDRPDGWAIVKMLIGLGIIYLIVTSGKR